MRFLSSVIVVLSIVTLPVVSLAGTGHEPKKFDPALSDKQLVDPSQCEKVYEMRGMQLCQPLRSKRIPFSGEVIKVRGNSEKTKRLGSMNQ
mgnify:CR=1 FL=1